MREGVAAAGGGRGRGGGGRGGENLDVREEDVKEEVDAGRAVEKEEEEEEEEKTVKIKRAGTPETITLAAPPMPPNSTVVVDLWPGVLGRSGAQARCSKSYMSCIVSRKPPWRAQSLPGRRSAWAFPAPLLVS
ncbi:hypothetical protein O3P69_000890 [Scylla paramamosain]|uniref:Uncharacterized protein n=1 Tax=Scylla paramamosain TaxID=85552 RepID=A0AAW0UUL7_SCYPA